VPFLRFYTFSQYSSPIYLPVLLQSVTLVMPRRIIVGTTLRAAVLPAPYPHHLHCLRAGECRGRGILAGVCAAAFH
jgi:hypothetical protein